MQIGPYVVEAEVARGGMGVVYRAREPGSEEPVAVKVLSASGERQQERFRREVRSLTSLRHPNLIRILAAGAEPRPWLAMELIEGESLQDLLGRAGPFDPDEAAEVVATAADAIGHCHGLGVLHRDLKPDNVLRASDGRIVVTDFGLALELEGSISRMSTSGILLGTPGFWPPEQARGDLAQIGPRSDVYGLGALLFALLTGEPPVNGSSLAEIAVRTEEHQVPPPSRLRPGVPGRLDRICARALAKAPEERYRSAAELALDLRGELELELEPPSRSWAVGGLIVAGLLVFGSGALAFGLARRGPVTTPTTSTTGSVTPVATATRTERTADGWFALAQELRRGGDEAGALAALRRAAEADHLEAIYELSGRLLKGVGAPQDVKAGVVWTRRGLVLGHPGCTRRMGELCLTQTKDPMDLARGVGLLERAVDLGDLEAMNILGGLLDGGKLMPQDLVRAAALYRRAAAAGDGAAANSYGSLLARGAGVERDDALALRFYRLAAKRGHAGAWVNLGSFQLEGRGGFKPDPVKARRSYLRGAEGGSAVAMYNLGLMDQNGVGVARDVTTARTWFERAAKGGFAAAMFELGNMYEYGRSVEVDPAQAAVWYRRSAEAGYVSGMNDLGILYRKGLGVEKDLGQAATWFRRAMEGGNTNGGYNLGLLHRDGLVPLDRTVMLQAFQVAASRGHVRALHTLGVIFEKGKFGIPRDRKRAAEYYAAGAKLGNQTCVRALARLTGLERD